MEAIATLNKVCHELGVCEDESVVADHLSAWILVHVMEHEATGSARVIDPVKAKDPSIPCTCFGYDTDEFCWKAGYLGLISSKRNPEQMATCQIKVPGGAGAQKRFRELKGTIAEAHKEWERKGEGLSGWWETVGRKLEEKGIEI